MRPSARKTLLWISLGALALTAILIILPWFLSPDYLKNLALQQIQQTFGPHVNVGQTTFSLFPQPHFLVSDIVVKERPEAHAVFRAQSISLELGIGQLLQKKIMVRKFSLNQPEMELHRNRSGAWRFLGHSGENSPIFPIAQFLVLGKFAVTDGKIIVIDESPKDIVRGMVLEDVNCVAETSREDSMVSTEIELSGRIRQKQEAAPFRITGNLEATLGSSPTEPSPSFMPFDRVTFKGEIVADQLEVSHLSEYFPEAASLSQFPGTLQIKTQVKWKQDSKGTQFHLTNIGLVSQAVTIAGNATIEGLPDDHFMLGASLRSSNLNLAQFRQYVPKSWIPKKMVSIWESGDWGGELDITEARVSGSTRSDVGTSVTGTFQLHNGFFSQTDWPTTDQLQGTVIVEPDRIQLTNVHGVYDGIPVDVTQGIVFLKDGGPWGEIELQGPVPMEKVLDFRNGKKGGAKPGDWLRTWKVKQGAGVLQLRFTGYIFDENGLKFQYGEYNPQNVVVQIPELLHDVSQGRGKILFSPDSTTFERIQGQVGLHPLLVNGTIIHHKYDRYEQLQFTMGMEGREIFSAWGNKVSSAQPVVKGPITLSVTLTGPTNRPKIKGKVEGNDAQIHIPQLLHKEAGQPGVLEFEGLRQSQNSVRFERIELVMLPIRLRGQGVMRFSPTWSWDGRLTSGPIYVGLLPEGLRVFEDVIHSGILEIQLGGKGVGTDWTHWDTKGWVALTEGILNIRGIEDPISKVFVRLKVDRERVDLKRIEFRLRDSAAVITGFVNDWKQTPDVSLMLESPQFDLNLLVPKDSRSALRDAVEWLAARGTLKGSVFVERPVYKNLSGKKLSAVLKVHDNLLSVDKVQAMVEEHGTLAGRMFVHLPEGKPVAMRASFQLKGVPFEKILKMSGDEHRIITGDTNIRGMIQGHGRDPRGVISTLNGRVEGTFKNGHVRHGTVLPKILTLLNLPNVLRGKVNLEEEGFPFKKVTTSLNIQEGIFTTKDFVVDSPIMKVTAAGNYDWYKDRVDGVAAVSPFGSYSKFLKKIPLFGRIFAGERKGIATAMFSVLGPLAKPNVTYMPVESLKTGLTGVAQLAFDILTNTITMPYDLLNGSKEDSSSAPIDSKQSGPSP